MKTKKCSKCGEIKDISEFHKYKRSKDGVRSKCKICRKDENTSSKERSKKYYDENKNEINKKRRACKLFTTADLCRAYGVKETTYYSRISKGMSHAQALTTKNQNNRTLEEKLHLRRKSQIKYKANFIKGSNLYIRDRYRSRIRQALMFNNAEKCFSSSELLGCSVEKAKAFIEEGFHNRETGEQMTWNNHSLKGWHIDHIKPCASFDLTDPEQQKECFHYTNLQPLWAEDNLRKSDKLDWVKEA